MMPVLFSYLAKLSISLSLVYLFYQLILRRLTFYNWNRFYLVLYTLLSFFIPFINITPVLEKNEIRESSIIRLVPALDTFNANTGNNILPGKITQDSSWGFWDWSLLVLLSGAFLLLARLCIQLLSFKKIVQGAKLISDEEIRLYQVNQRIIPFSFGRSIFINRELHHEEELKDIIRHEIIHVRQKHTADIIWSELFCILNWYNPFAWLTRKAIRQNLEFIADNKVLQSGMDKKQYQYLLLKVIGNNHFSIAQNFNFSSLKKRIAMMNKMKSARVHLIKFLFVLPVVAIMLVAFRHHPSRTIGAKETESFSKLAMKNGYVDSVPATKSKLRGPLWIVDGKEIEFEKGERIDPATVESMQVWKGDSAIKKYQQRGEYGVVEITTKHALPDQKNTSFPVTDTIIINSKGYILDVRNEDNKDIVVIKDKNQRVVKEIPLLQWNQRKEYYEGIYGEGVDEIIEHAVKESMGLENRREEEKLKPGKNVYMRERINNAKILHITADTLQWLASENKFFFTGKILANDIINDMRVQGEGMMLDWPKSYVLINGSELDVRKDYISYDKSNYWIVSLSKEEAMRKYGAKGKNGAVEIISEN